MSEAGAGTTHGTYACYVSGCRCDKCRAANTVYKAQWRKDKPEGYAKELAYNAARGRALERLASVHRAQFAVLIDGEVAAQAQAAKATTTAIKGIDAMTRAQRSGHAK